MSTLLALLLAVARPGAASDADPTAPPPTSTAVVVAVADGPDGPGARLADLAHQLRGACLERAADVLDVAGMRVRLGLAAGSSVAELDRAYVGAQAAFQADELDSAAGILRALMVELERGPESPEAHARWVRAGLRLALVERTARRAPEVAAVLDRLLALDPDVVADPRQYAPGFRRDLEAARRRSAARPRHALTVTSSGPPALVHVDGKTIGTTPARVLLPPGRYRVTGTIGALRAPPVAVALGDADAEVELDLALGGALRPDAGPGLAAAPADRAALVARLGAWLEVERVLTVSLGTDGDAPALVGALYDVERGELVREGRVRLAGGAPASAAVGALATFLLAGEPVPGVAVTVPVTRPTAAAATDPGVALAARRLPAEEVRSSGGDPHPSTARWLRPAAFAAGALALGAATYATVEAFAARGGYRDAAGLLRADGSMLPGTERAQYDAAVASADGARRNAWIGAAGAAVLAGAAGVLGYLSLDAGAAPGAAAAVRF